MQAFTYGNNVSSRGNNLYIYTINKQYQVSETNGSV